MENIGALLKKAKAGDAEAQYKLGDCYYWGEEGVVEDKVEAVKWYRKAAEQGNVNAKKALEHISANGAR